jgi:hypothetical protein
MNPQTGYTIPKIVRKRHLYHRSFVIFLLCAELPPDYTRAHHGTRASGAAPRQHDANYLTFHRFRRFRTLAMTDSVSGTRPGDGVWSAAEP